MIADQIKQKLATATGLDISQIQLSRPENPEFGDFAANSALRLSKELKKPPFEIAQDIKAKIGPGDLIEKIEVVQPGFVNFYIKPSVLLQEAKQYAAMNQDEWFHTLHDHNKGKEAIVEYSSPNIAKPFTVGHLRSTIIGDAVANLLQASGWKVYRDNHLGDWGTQFGKQIYAIQHIKITKTDNQYSYEHAPTEDVSEHNIQIINESERPIKILVELYIKFHDLAEADEKLEDTARENFKHLEAGDKEMVELWKLCIDWSFKEFDLIYGKLGVHFTENSGRGYGESFFEDKMQAPLEQLKQFPDHYKESKNAMMFFFTDDTFPPLMILKQDGATLYSTRDLATDNFRKSHYPNVSLIINEVGAEQSLYFQQLYEIEKQLGWYKEGQRIHVKHGLYRFKDMKMSTRKGNVIWLEDVLEEAKNRAAALQKEHDVAEVVSIGALKWNDLKRSSHHDIVFDWDEILNMQGNSGPYVQYSYVRALSILTKEKYADISPTEAPALNPDELQLLRLFSKYPEVVEMAAQSYSPHLVATYLYELAQAFNLFYQKYPILKETGAVKQLRLLLTVATSNILKHGLSLLGIQTVEKM